MPELAWTPHSGYHGGQTRGRFFEGWYFRVTLPVIGESFAFMYSIDDPAGHSPLTGGAVQILGPGEQYLHCPLPEVQTFWAWRHCLGLGHWHQSSAVPPRYLSPEQFFQHVEQGYQVTATQHQGCIQDATTGAIARWNYAIEPLYGWGSPQSPSLPTAGWLSYLPIFEPGWQVLMAHGWATGWVEWGGRRFDLTRAPAYGEKNWGGAFPERWFWMQCNAFTSNPDLTVTAAGGWRRVLGRREAVGLVGIHSHEHCIILSSLKARMTWKVNPWGWWLVTLQDHRYHIRLTGHTTNSPITVRVPTLEGLTPICWDTTQGELRLQVWQRSPINSNAIILDTTSHLAGLEVGGQGWNHPWHVSEY